MIICANLCMSKPMTWFVFSHFSLNLLLLYCFQWGSSPWSTLFIFFSYSFLTSSLVWAIPLRFVQSTNVFLLLLEFFSFICGFVALLSNEFLVDAKLCAYGSELRFLTQKSKLTYQHNLSSVDSFQWVFSNSWMITFSCARFLSVRSLSHTIEKP